MMKTTQHPKRQFWQRHIEAWHDSGLSQSEYCRQKKLSRYGFSYWKKRLAIKQNADLNGTIVALPFSLPLTCIPQPHVPIGLVINRFRVEISGDFDSAILEKLILTLGRLQ